MKIRSLRLHEIALSWIVQTVGVAIAKCDPTPPLAALRASPPHRLVTRFPTLDVYRPS